MYRQKLPALVCVTVLMSTCLQAKADDGPIFTIPKTVVTVDMQIDKVVQTPGTLCEFIDLFMPGVETAVPCNGNILPPLMLHGDGQRPGDVLTIDSASWSQTAAERSISLKDAITKAKNAQEKAANEAGTLAQEEKKLSNPVEAEKIERPLTEIMNGEKALALLKDLLAKVEPNKDILKKTTKEVCNDATQFQAYFPRGDKAIICKSPEQFLSNLRDGVAKGTNKIQKLKDSFSYPMSRL